MNNTQEVMDVLKEITGKLADGVLFNMLTMILVNVGIAVIVYKLNEEDKQTAKKNKVNHLIQYEMYKKLSYYLNSYNDYDLTRALHRELERKYLNAVEHIEELKFTNKQGMEMLDNHMKQVYDKFMDGTLEMSERYYRNLSDEWYKNLVSAEGEVVLEYDKYNNVYTDYECDFKEKEQPIPTHFKKYFDEHYAKKSE